MNTAVMSLIFRTFLLCLFAASCQAPLVSDDDQTSGEAVWERIDYTSERLITGLHATPFEWYVLSENQFARLDGDDELIEKRPLSEGGGIRGIPALSDNTFARVSIDSNAHQVIEFHLAHSPQQIIKINTDSLRSPGDDLLEADVFGRSIGAFSTDGSVFMMPARVYPDRIYVVLLFEVLQNMSHDEFISVEMVKRIDLPDISADFSSINSVRFLDGNFYLTSREGAWRITPSGETDQIFSQWMLDVFSREGNLYATGLNSFDLHRSTDNGISWERLNQDSGLKFTETPGDILLTQVATSNAYQLVEEDLGKARNIIYPAGVDPRAAIFYDAVFFAGRYYFSMDRAVYATEEVVVE